MSQLERSAIVVLTPAEAEQGSRMTERDQG